MQCPRDNASLEPREIHEVVVQVCPADGGMYLAKGELNKVADETAGDLEYSTLDLDSFEHADDSPPARCPRDPDVVMQKVEFVIETNIILDHCPRCHGFWLDGGELVRINEEVRNLNEADRQVPDRALETFAQFIWMLPVPK
ncbi:MAG TPA: zf-TFIIB domain-containing protein [Thermoanaerobaculia bacterium]|nr:zf-TFIIB domain-containing protein [Thermoanaerobaculia bacterium]